MKTKLNPLDIALSYASKKWKVFPIAPKAKVAVAGVKWSEEATDDVDKINEWWNMYPDAGIGIATGAKSGIIVMDIDDKNGGLEELERLKHKNGDDFTRTLCVKTGGGGYHLFFKHPGRHVKSRPGVYDGIDSKADGGYVVAPPSLHASKNTYEWVNEEAVLLDAPKFWVDKIIKKPIRLPEKKYLIHDAIHEGSRNEELYKLACSMRAFGGDEESIESLLSKVNTMRCTPPVDYKELCAIVQSALKHEAGNLYESENIPHGYIINQFGLFFTTENKKGEPEVINVSPIPIYITGRYKNVDSKKEKIEISFYKENEWHKIVVLRSIAFNASKIIELADHGLPVSSSNSKHLVRYLYMCECGNMSMEVRKSVSHLGWVDKSFQEFLPGDSVYLDAEESMVRGYEENGDISQWVQDITPVLKYDIVRFMLAASFASPLLKMLGGRSFVIYVYGPSRGGKTAATKVALSVWGNPEEIMMSFNSTANAVERKAAFNGNVPIGIDERQVVKDQGTIEQMIYMLANGQSRGRANKDGSLQESVTWQNITMATGEDSLTTDSTRGGVVSRVLEFFTQPIPDEHIASSMHEKTEENYGLAGSIFVREMVKMGRDELKKQLRDVKEDITSLCPDNVNSHISAVSIIALADKYMHEIFLNKEDSDYLLLGKRILEMLQDKNDVDDAKRAYDEFMSWYAVNQNSFDKDFNKEIYGWKQDDGYIYIYPTIFKKTMRELGFNERRIKQDWAKKEWLKTEIQQGKLRLTVRSTNPSTHKSERVVAVKYESGQ